MIFRNTPANLRLARRMEQTVNAHTGFHAVVSRNWNCGEDVRFEIGTSHALNIPFIVSTFFSEDGSFEFKVRMIKTALDSAEIIALKTRLADLESIGAALKKYIAEAKPERSSFDD